MNDEPTQDLTDSGKLDLLLAEMRDVKAELHDVNARLSAIEEDRARDTKPLLGEIRKEVGEVRLSQERLETQLRYIDRKFNVLTQETC